MVFWWFLEKQKLVIYVLFEMFFNSTLGDCAVSISVVRIHLWSLNCYPKLLLTVFIFSDAKRFNNFAHENMETERWTYFLYFFYETGQFSLKTG